MHFRPDASLLGRFTDAHGSDAHRVFRHLQTIETWAPDCVATVLCVVRRVQGKSWGRFAGLHARRDGVYLCFEMADGSILAVARDPSCVRVDAYGDPWPWLLIADDRESWEAIMMLPSSPAELLEDCLAVKFEVLAAVAA